ncbi:hypothetical protein A2U01_0104980, partial [Trifolium medium]|nr:hypothetical protein [Trifolium medium]
MHIAGFCASYDALCPSRESSAYCFIPVFAIPQSVTLLPPPGPIGDSATVPAVLAAIVVGFRLMSLFTGL